MPDYLTIPEAAARAGRTPRSMQRWVRDGAVDSVLADGRSSNGRRVALVVLASLDEHLQRIGEGPAVPESPSAPAHLPVPAAPTPAPSGSDTLAAPLADAAGASLPVRRGCPPPAPYAPDSLSYIPITREGLPNVAAMRDMGLGSLVDEFNRRMQAAAALKEALATAAYGTRRATTRRVATLHGTSWRTLYRWQQTLDEGGPGALIPDWPGTRRFVGFPQLLQARIIEAHLLTHKTDAQVHRDVVVAWYAERGAHSPHLSTTRRFINRYVRPLEETYFREGRQAFRAKVEAKSTRALPDPGAVWSMDHRLCDVMVLLDGKPVRLYMTAITDTGSAAFLAWRFGLTPTAAGVCHALRDALMVFGPPDVVVRDNGKEFTAKRLGGKARRGPAPDASLMPRDVAEEHGIWTALGIRLVTSIPYTPWGKPIEAHLGAFSSQWENETVGWCGRSAQQKPADLPRLIERGLLLTAEQFAQVFAEQVDRWNEGHVCGKRPAPPLQMLRSHVGAQARAARAPSAEVLTFLLQDVRKLTVGTAGISLDGILYRSAELMQHVGRRVVVRWDKEAPEHAFVVTPEDETLAVAPAQVADWQGWGPANMDTRRIARSQRDRLRLVANAVTGSTPIDQLDSTGSRRLVAERIVGEQADAVMREAHMAAAAQQRAVETTGAEAPPEPEHTLYQSDAEARRLRDLRRTLARAE